MIIKYAPIPLSLFGILIFLPAAHAAILLSDNFETYSAGNQLGTSGTPWTRTDNKTAKSTMFVRDDGTAAPFGASNQYLELVDTGTVTSPGEYLRIQSGTYTQASNALTTLQFDFFEPIGGGSNFGFGFAMTNNDLNTAGSRLRLTLNDGTIGGSGFTAANNSYSLNTAYTIYVIFNDTVSGTVYDGGTVAAGTADVWFSLLGGGSMTFAGSAAVQNSQAASYSVAFRTFNGDVQDMHIDNVSLFEGAAVVPEPSTGCIALLGSLLLLGRRRR